MSSTSKLNVDTISTTNILANGIDSLTFLSDGSVRAERTPSLHSDPRTIATLANVMELGDNGGNLFDIIPWNGPVEAIPPGLIPANGQQLFIAPYTAAWDNLEAGKQFMVSELLWQTGETGNPDKYKGCWSSGGIEIDDKEVEHRWYRVPKLNADDNYRAPFIRGSQVGVDAGALTLDQFQGHKHRTVTMSNPPNATSFNQAFGGDTTSLTMLAGVPSVATGYAVYTGGIVPDGESENPRVGSETHPRYHGVIMCIRMFGVVSNAGSLDAAQLATDLNVANARIAALESHGIISAEGQATLTGVDNKITMLSIVSRLALEPGDVIEISGAGVTNAKLRSVETIIDGDSIVVNYEHCGARGNGPLKLEDFTGDVTIKRIVKHYHAPIGLGQEWVNVERLRPADVNVTNTTGRAIQFAVNVATGLGVFINNMQIAIGTESYQSNVQAVIPNGGEYKASAYGTWRRWSELR